MPDFESKTFWFTDTSLVGTYNPGALPNITGTLSTGFRLGWAANGAFYTFGEPAQRNGATSLTDGYQSAFDWAFDASRSKSAYNRLDNMVVPTSINVLAVIKY